MATTAFFADSAVRASHASERSAYYYSIYLYSSIGYWIGYYYTYTYSTYREVVRVDRPLLMIFSEI